MSSLRCPPLASVAYMSLCVLLLLLLPIECNHLKTRLTFPSMATSIEIINKKNDRPTVVHDSYHTAKRKEKGRRRKSRHSSTSLHFFYHQFFRSAI
ncbi:hypothetical protein DFH08DRAFT_838992 [Mycena albidolilacea]|uniref:Secreted protein n=1 Tax=Mycena albidolilacea TaxID=1033008 RepID=A0AAD7AQ30_9AGAR|nr:hypothetical protein DFH08DRAFT_838992 [Mycena albidolilacea]